MSTSPDLASRCGRIPGLCSAAAELAHRFAQGVGIGPNGLLAAFEQTFSSVDVPQSHPAAGKLISDILVGYVVVAGEQTTGLGRFYGDIGETMRIRLYPTMTLLRGVAEAAARIHWLTEPWTDPSGTNEGSWEDRSRRVVGRAELDHLEVLCNRVRRLKASPNSHPEHLASAQQRLRWHRERLSNDPEALVTGRPQRWVVYGQKLPVLTDWVTVATEYAHGQRHLGRGLRVYPLYSGFAHGSLDVLYAPAKLDHIDFEAVTTSELGVALDIAGTALRTFAAAFDVATTLVDRVAPEFAAWESDVDAVILEARDAASN